MFSKKNQPKLTPEQKHRLEEVARADKYKGAFMRDKLYPLLVDLTIDDAKLKLQTMGLVIDQAFTNQKKEVTVASLEAIKAQFDKDSTAKDYEALYEILKDETVTQALDLMGSMGNLIVQNERQANKEKKVSELPIRFITYDNEQRWLDWKTWRWFLWVKKVRSRYARRQVDILFD